MKIWVYGRVVFKKAFAPIVRKGTFHKKGTFVKRAIVEKNNSAIYPYFHFYCSFKKQFFPETLEKLGPYTQIFTFYCISKKQFFRKSRDNIHGPQVNMWNLRVIFNIQGYLRHARNSHFISTLIFRLWLNQFCCLFTLPLLLSRFFLFSSTAISVSISADSFRSPIKRSHDWLCAGISLA